MTEIEREREAVELLKARGYVVFKPPKHQPAREQVKPSVEKVCVQCGETFLVDEHMTNIKKYCSKKCMSRASYLREKARKQAMQEEQVRIQAKLKRREKESS